MAEMDDWYNQANQLKEQGKFDEAVAKYNEIIASDPQYSLAHSALAIVLGKMGRHEDAVRHALRVVELAPSDPFSYTALSVTCQRAGKIQMAEDAMARAHIIRSNAMHN